MHHAYVYEGPFSLLEKLADSARELFDFKNEGDPDMHVLAWEKFGIEESRDLTQQASLKPMSGKALFVVGVSTISTDAQQALLKLFEEPQAGVTFVLLVPHGALIATLRSRFLVYPLRLEEESLQASAAKKFLSSAYKERSAQVTALLKEEEGTRERVREFLAALEVLLHKNISKKEFRDALADVALVRGYAADRSASNKMLLEHLAAVLPRFDLKTELSKVEP